MRRGPALFLLLAACVSMRPVSAFQAPPGVAQTAVDRARLDQFVAASESERRSMVTASPDILDKPFVEALSAAGNTLRLRGDLASAEKWYGTVLWIGRTYAKPGYEAVGLNNLGTVAGTRGDLAGARRLFEQGLAIATANNDRLTIQSTLGNLAVLLRRVGDLDGALAAQMRALDLARELDNAVAIAKTLNNIGVVLYDQGNHARAIQYYVESLAIKEQNNPEPSDLVNTLTNIGSVYSTQGDYALALNYYQRSLDVMEKTGAPDVAVTTALNNMGHAYIQLNDMARARASLTKSLALGEKIGDPVKIATPIYNLANVARQEGRLDEAETLHRRGLELREQGEDRLGIVESLTSVGNVVDRRGRPEEALPYVERAVVLADQSRLLNQLWRAQGTLGHIHAELGHWAEARASYEAAIATIELIRGQTAGGERGRQQFLSERMGPYFGLAGLHASAKRPFDALAVVDQARARSLIDILASGQQPTRRLTDELRQEERDVTQGLLTASNQLDGEARKPKPNAQRMAELDRNLSKARLSREAFLGQLYAAQPELRFARGNTPDLTEARVAALLKPGTAIVTFVLDERKAWAYIVTRGPNGPIVTTQELASSTQNIADLAERFSRQIASRDLGFAPTARALYTALFGQADALLTNVRHLIIIPDGPLWQVPFDALQTPRGRFLVEERALSYTPSIAALSTLEDRRRSRATRTPYLVALGDPVITDSQQPATSGRGSGASLRGTVSGRLPEAAREVRELGRLYGTARSQVLVAADATETALRERVSKATVLHVATHGVLDNRNPMYSHLLLARGSKDGKANLTEHSSDGRLEAWEVLDIGINANLAVLSACQTAGGGTGWGEGVIGLSWSLFGAGASTAVVSLWEVDSASTTSLMIAFHDRLLKTGAAGSVPEALRQAELSVLKNPASRHPFYWAGFISVGAR